MSVANNIVANYLGSISVAVTGFVFVPVYLYFLGVEAYGIIGFYMVISSSMAVLDFGLSAAATRELASLPDTDDKNNSIREIIYTLEIVLWCVSIFFGTAVLLSAPIFVEFWLNTNTLDFESTVAAVRLMGISFFIQLPLSLYNGALIGLQRQVTLNIITSLFAIFKSGGAALVLWLVSSSIEAFFTWQIIVAVLNFLVISKSFKYCFPNKLPAKFSYDVLWKLWRFSSGVCGVNVLSFILMQSDKIIVSTVLSLKEFGYYTLAWLAANLVSRIVGPIYSAYFPKLVKLVTVGEREEIKKSYLTSCQIMALIIVPSSLMIAFFSFDIMNVWLQNSGLAENIRWVVSVLVLGNMINGLMTIPYGLQLAFGWTSLALKTNVISVFLAMPALYFLSIYYGILGASFVWLFLNLGYFIITPYVMHKKILTDDGSKREWYTQSVLIPTIICFSLFYILFMFNPFAYFSSFVSILLLCLGVVISVCVNGILLENIRRIFYSYIINKSVM